MRESVDAGPILRELESDESLVPFFAQGNVPAAVPFEFDEYFGRAGLILTPTPTAIQLTCVTPGAPSTISRDRTSVLLLIHYIVLSIDPDILH